MIHLLWQSAHTKKKLLAAHVKTIGRREYNIDRVKKSVKTYEKLQLKNTENLH